MITVVDYGRGNIFSICAALRQCGAEFELTSSPEALVASNKVVLPGVGAFGAAADGLRERGLWQALLEFAGAGKPLLGICVGMQLMADKGEEFGLHDGLGLAPGVTRRLPDFAPGPDGFRIPNVGWRPLRRRRAHPLLAGVDEGEMMYFVHSYALTPSEPEDLVATIRCNGADVAAMVSRETIVGCQFHPERSGPTGLRLIENFVGWKP